MPDRNANSEPAKDLGASIALLRQLEWRARQVVQSSLSGEYKSSFRGKGMEFDQVVKYEYGDDVRDIDWNVTARLGEAYRKKFVEEREVTLLLDEFLRSEEHTSELQSRENIVCRLPLEKKKITP